MTGQKRAFHRSIVRGSWSLVYAASGIFMLYTMDTVNSFNEMPTFGDCFIDASASLLMILTTQVWSV